MFFLCFNNVLNRIQQIVGPTKGNCLQMGECLFFFIIIIIDTLEIVAFVATFGPKNI